jgi:hypothetical protein
MRPSIALRSYFSLSFTLLVAVHREILLLATLERLYELFTYVKDDSAVAVIQ